MISVNSLQKFVKTSQNEDEELNVNSVQEIDVIALYSHFLEGEIHRLSLNIFFRAHYGDNLISKAMIGNERLQQLKPLVPLQNKDTQCLKQNIAKDQLPETISFSDRKTRYAQCVQFSTPLGIIPCLKATSKGLPPAQQTELAMFTPKAIAGGKINTVMAPFAALSKLIQVTMKGLYLGAVTNACLETDPENFKQCVVQLRSTLEGRDPDFNKKIIESMPRWVLKAGELLAQGADKLQSLDNYMFEEFRTFPGIVHEGISGMIDAGLPAATGVVTKVIGRTVATGVNVVKSTVQTVRDVSEIDQIVSTLFREATKGSMETFSVKPGMQIAAKNMTIFTSETDFANALAKNVSLKNATEVLPSVAQGRSGSSVYFVQRGDQSLPIVIKDFPGLIAPHSRFGQEILAYNMLRDLNLTHLQLPQLLKVGKILPENGYYSGLLAMSRLPGKSLAETLENQSLLRGTAKVLQLQENYTTSNAIGKAIGELHGRSRETIVPSQIIMDLHAQRVRMFFETAQESLQSSGFEFSFNKNHVESMISDFFKNPGKAGYAHGDAHYGNFIWDSTHKRLGAIDTGSVSQLLDKFGKPAGIQAQDIAGVKVTSEFFARRSGMTTEEISTLHTQFMNGYTQEAFSVVHTPEALRFYECYWRLFVLNSNHQAHDAWLKSIESLNLLFRQPSK